MGSATFYATVSAGFTIEQLGLPNLSVATDAGNLIEQWNGDSPRRRLDELAARHGRHVKWK
jgi:hypothetical protein